MATVLFMAGEGFAINDTAGSGLAFFESAGFATSIYVGSYNGRTYISNGAGTTQGPEADNVKYLNAGSGILGQTGSGIALTAIPNYQATLMIEANLDTPGRVQNPKLYIYDRASINNPPSGVTCYAAEIIHPDTTQSNVGSGDTTWQNVYGSGSVLNLCPSPGTSGLYAGNGSNGNWSDTKHRWHVALSATPQSIGSKTFGLYFSCEYLA